MNLKFFLIVIFLCVSNASAQEQKTVLSTKEDISDSVEIVPCSSENRQTGVKNLFREMGAKAEDITIEKFNKDRIQNVVVKLKGKTDETVIIGAHYDHVGGGCGAIDNWTGISILAHLFKTLKQLELNKTYIFVAFDQEEKGLLGSAAMAKEIPKENLSNYCAMINLDSFGFNTPFSLQQSSSGKMVKLAQSLAEENKMKFQDVRIEGADADSTSFKTRKIPAITFSGLDGKWQTYLHSKNDQIDKINMESVYLGYRFALAFVAKIDALGCADLQK